MPNKKLPMLPADMPVALRQRLKSDMVTFGTCYYKKINDIYVRYDPTESPANRPLECTQVPV